MKTVEKRLRDLLGEFQAVASDDAVKSDLELTHTPCGGVVCDVEPGDTLDILVAVASEHQCGGNDES
jgi:hypothetical protein